MACGRKGGAEEGLSFAFRFTDTILQTPGIDARCIYAFMQSADCIYGSNCGLQRRGASSHRTLFFWSKLVSVSRRGTPDIGVVVKSPELADT